MKSIPRALLVSLACGRGPSLWAWSKLLASTSLTDYLKGFLLKIRGPRRPVALASQCSQKPEAPPTQALTSVHWLWLMKKTLAKGSESPLLSAAKRLRA